MADAARSEGTSWPATLLLVFAGVGVLGKTEPWDLLATTTAGEAAVSVGADFSRGGGVPTRLWEDPLRPRQVAAALQAPPGLESSGAYGVLAVCVPGGMGGESVEMRRRTRFAVQAALTTAGFEPLLGARVTRGEVAGIGFAYEWCGPDPQQAGRGTQGLGEPTLLVWVDEESIVTEDLEQGVGGAILGAMDLTFNHQDVRRGSEGLPRHVARRSRVIGPTHSGNLLKLRESAGEAGSFPAQEGGPQFDWFSPWATIPLRPSTPEQWVASLDPAWTLWGVRPAGAAKAGVVEAAFSTAPGDQTTGGTGRTEATTTVIGPATELAESVAPEGWAKPFAHVLRTITPDDLVADRLVSELRLRCGADLEGGEILLVIEQDTAFGRSWVRNLTQALEIEAADPQLRVVHYTRGLGGRPRDGAQVGAGSADPRTIDLAAGPRQLDYLRRLQSRIGEFESRVRAVGVFGSDVYDKLRVLRALRPVVRDATFFSSDLDSRLCHPQYLPWTRNLVLVSAYGLEPPTRRQLESTDAEAARVTEEDRASHVHPPFRDGYQTAVFQAARRALGLDADLQILPIDQEVQAFEISTTGPVSLDSPRVDRRALWLALAATGLVMLGAFLVFARRGELTRVRRRRPALFWGAMAATVGGPLLLAAIILSNAASPDGEPFSLAQGISVWPTEIIRVGCGLLAMWFAILAMTRIEATERRVGEQYGLERPGHDPGRRQLTASDVWCTHRREQRPFMHFIRAIGCALIAFVLFRLLMVVLGEPVAPVRGAFARGVDLVVVIGSVGAMQVLLFLVFDLCRTTTRVLNQLGERLDYWPDNDAHPRRIGLNAAEAARVDYLQITRELADNAQSLVFFPAVVILFMVLSRHTTFDAWTWPAGLVLVVSASAAIVLGGSIVLGVTARRIRGQVVTFLDEQQQILRGEPDAGMRIQHLGEFRSRFARLETAAFATLGSHPAVRALLIPTGGIGGLTLIDWVVRARDFA